MEKRVWTCPTAVVEEFMANQYIAASCGDSGTVYNFKCNAGSRYRGYNVYLADGSPYCTSGEDYGNQYIDGWGYFKPCGEEHSAESDSVFLKGYMYKQDFDGDNTGSRIDVIIWTDNYTNCHCTTELDMDKWETLKS